ncbi:(2Fe-2S)-binding protein [Achromobacter aloeverae]|uniref:Sulfurtransferase n=1 Tax=Achromobacter aloeverae TaxID=1750518 RepID=A0A4Q1HKY6_9BURK|nr:(2Fe-2S)-binding protein [Achromobacter aloeverae]RXN87965.1 sulfurtransferase [Achromobacter aloeverae]
MPILKRLAETARAPVAFTLDGAPVQALMGDTVLTAVLTHIDHVRRSEFSGGARAGFCMMGACQDCWMLLEEGGRVRACSTFIEPGMRLLSQWPAAWRTGQPTATAAAPAADVEAGS